MTATRPGRSGRLCPGRRSRSSTSCCQWTHGPGCAASGYMCIFVCVYVYGNRSSTSCCQWTQWAGLRGQWQPAAPRHTFCCPQHTFFCPRHTFFCPRHTFCCPPPAPRFLPHGAKTHTTERRMTPWPAPVPGPVLTGCAALTERPFAVSTPRLRRMGSGLVEPVPPMPAAGPDTARAHTAPKGGAAEVGDVEWENANLSV